MGWPGRVFYVAQVFRPEGLGENSSQRLRRALFNQGPPIAVSHFGIDPSNHHS